LCDKISFTLSQAPGAHAYNPSYSGGRDQEDCGGSEPTQIVLETLSQKTLHKNRAGGVSQGEGPEFKPQYHTHTHTHTQINFTQLVLEYHLYFIRIH
jgi:hypothetical protein